MPKRDIWLKILFQYRNSKGRLLPYVVNVDFDVCKIKTGEETTLSPLMIRVIKFIGTIAKSHAATHGCPLTIGPNIAGFNFEDVKKQFFPPIIPEGMFVLYWSLHLGNNHTLLDLRVNAHVTSTGVMQLSMLNMG